MPAVLGGPPKVETAGELPKVVEVMALFVKNCPLGPFAATVFGAAAAAVGVVVVGAAEAVPLGIVGGAAL